jgi:hypothetical protein
MRVLALLLGLLGSLGAAVSVVMLFSVSMGEIALQDGAMKALMKPLGDLSYDAGTLLRTYGSWDKVPPGEMQAYHERSFSQLQPVAQRQLAIVERYLPSLTIGVGFALLALVGAIVAA